VSSEKREVWGILEVRAITEGEDREAGALRWRGFQATHPTYEEALSWAHHGSAVFGRPSDTRLPHPTIKDAQVIVDQGSLFMVFPIPAGADRREHSERIYRAAPQEWLGSLLGV
jgi:hypothetical protein